MKRPVAYCAASPAHVLARWTRHGDQTVIEYRALVAVPEGLAGTWTTWTPHDRAVEGASAMCPCNAEYHLDLTKLAEVGRRQLEPLFLQPLTVRTTRAGKAEKRRYGAMPE